jgi:hypothetical protein
LFSCHRLSLKRASQITRQLLRRRQVNTTAPTTFSFHTVTSNHHPFRCKWSHAFCCRHICSRRGPSQRCCARLCSANTDLCSQALAMLMVTPHAAAPAGLTDTRLAARIMSSEPAKQMSLAMHALGRFGSASDCASVVDLLLDSTR